MLALLGIFLWEIIKLLILDGLNLKTDHTNCFFSKLTNFVQLW